MLCLSQPEKATVALWIRWSELTTWQHLLISCYILESQQAMLLAREPHSSMLPVSGLDLPYPTHSLVWDAEDFEAWSSVGVQYSFAPQYVFQALQSESPAAATPYQSALLIAATYNRFGVTASYDSSPTHVDISALLDSSFATHLAFLTARLTQVTPIRALLAVSGESWILSEKVSSPQTFAEYKIILRTWVHQLWSGSSTCDHFNPVKEALELSVTILRLVMDEQIDLCTLEMGTDMGLYFATLTLWTIAAALGARSRHTPRPSQQAFLRRYSESPSTSLLLSEAIHGQTTASYESSQFPEHDELGIAQSQPSSPTRRDSLLTTPLQSHEQIAVTTKTFLVFASHALSMNPLSHSSLSLGNIQAGCEGLLLWTKLCLRSAPVFKDNDSTTWPFAPGDGLGELLDSMVGSIERILGHGWNGWGF